MRTSRTFTKVLCGLVLFQGLLNGYAGESQGEQILFLHLKITSNVVRLLDSKAVPGHLKATVTAEKPGDLYLELISTNSATLWTGFAPDPLVHRYEYEDPDHPGQLKVKEVKRNQAEFTIRVPGQKAAKQLNIYRLDKSAEKTATVASNKTRTLLGTLDLPDPGSVR